MSLTVAFQPARPDSVVASNVPSVGAESLKTFTWMVPSGIGYGLSPTVMTPGPAVATVISALWLLTGGASVVTGFRPEMGLGLIVAFLVVVTPKMHDFWTVTDPTQRMGQFINFQKNVALAGAALMMLAIPRPWPYSL